MSDTTAPPTRRWARDYLYDILRELEIRYIFGVPGTNEIPVIDGSEVPGNDVTYIECLQEGIATGAAMGYARMSGKPGVVIVHVTPGIANSVGNLFNASRSRVPLVILCGQQQNELVTQEPLLASDVVQVARQYCKWAHELRAWEEIPLVLQRAFKEAMAPPHGPVFVSFPWDFPIHEIPADSHVKGVTRIPQRFTGDEEAVRQAAAALSAAQSPVIICGDAVGYADAWPELQRVAELLGAPVYLEGQSSMSNFPNRDYHWQGELPGSQASTQQLLQPHDVAFLCGFGAQAQLVVFKYSDGPLIPPHIKQVYLTNNTWDIGKNDYGEVAVLGDVKSTLPFLVAALEANPPAGADGRNEALREADAARAAAWAEYLETAMGESTIWGVVVADALRQVIEEKGLSKRFVFVNEAISDATSFEMLLPFGPDDAAPTSYYCVEGGSLGYSMPASLGIKLEPQGWQGITADLVVNAVGDGSTLFTPQVWWTAAHRRLPVLYVVMNNQEYHTLQLGLQSVVTVYGTAPGFNWTPVNPNPEYLTIQRPTIDFVKLAAAFGVEHGQIVTSPDKVLDALREGAEHVLTQRTSYVLDVRIAAAEQPVPSQTPVDAETAPLGLSAPPPTLYAYYSLLRTREENAGEPRALAAHALTARLKTAPTPTPPPLPSGPLIF